MSKQDTVNKYIDAFLRGRSEESKAKFRAKDLHLQYASIMQWRRKIRKEENTPKSTKEILDSLKRIASLIANAPSISDEDSRAIEAELDALKTNLREYNERQRQRIIDELEQKSRMIALELNKLRGE